jgi:hypothetical protein
MLNYPARHRNGQRALVRRKIALAPLRRSLDGALGANAPHFMITDAGRRRSGVIRAQTTPRPLAP